MKGNRITDFYHLGGGIEHSTGLLCYDMFGLGNAGHVVSALQLLWIEGNTFLGNERAIGAVFANGSSFIANSIQGAGGNLKSEGLLVSGGGIEARGNRFETLTTGMIAVGNDPQVGTIYGIASDVDIIGSRFCNVQTPVERQPQTSNISESNSLSCPFLPPPLGVTAAVLLSWPDDGQTHLLESAPAVNGPWTPVNAAGTTQNGQATFAVKTDGAHQYFRLR